MKVEVTTKQQQFKPIDLKITIESQEELNTWLSIFNGCETPQFICAVEEHRSKYANGKLAVLNSYPAYTLLQTANDKLNK